MELKHDLQIDIATANSRKARLWKNRTVPWSELAEKVLMTTRTPETLAEYRKMGKTQQAQIKDVGGFVGGYCNNGRRSDVHHRSVLTLDADEASPDLWDDYKMIVGCAAAVYSTHKHTADKPRLRLVLPLSRAVTPDEYQAIGRRVADDLGIDQFDDTTYQAARLMYWPSTSQDGVFFAEVFDAPALDPDKVLSRYKDWRDISSWPVSSRVAEIIKKEASKQADPTEKTGLVGAFCRAYSIEDAIETFVESYSPCGDGRYTYDLGSTAGGVTTYEGKFSYSFHATDPASGQLCNAWDLVRIHKFNELDTDVDPDKQPGSRPSWKAMQDLAANDSRVKAQILSDRSSDFDEPVPEDDWISNLKITKDGAVASTIDNAVIILEHDPTLSGTLMYNGLTHTIGTSRALPWKDDPGGWSDADDSGLRYYLEKAYALSGKDKIFDAVNVVAMRHQTHPVREYLSGCGWDGVPRLDTLLIDYLGAEDNEYVRAVTRKTLVAAVARIFNPGVKFDYMLTLQGRQGIGKSALIAKLGGKWFSDTFSTLQGKDAYEQLHGVWIMEVGELAGMKKPKRRLLSSLSPNRLTASVRPTADGRRNSRGSASLSERQMKASSCETRPETAVSGSLTPLGRRS